MVKRFLHVFLLISIYLISLSQADAREWTIVGPRAMGMGGANVAVANDATASYWNPAAYGFFKHETGGEYGKRKWSAVLDAGVGASTHEGLGEQMDKISKMDFDAIDNGQIAPNKVADFLQLVNELKAFSENSNRAIKINANGGLRTQVGNWGLGAYAFGELSGKPQLDLVNILPVDTPATFLNDFTNPASYGCSTCSTVAFDDSDSNGLSAGQKSELNTFLTTLGWTSAQSIGFINSVDNGLEQAQAGGKAIPSDIVQTTKNVASLANTAASSGGTLANNNSRLIFKGIAVGETPLTYGRAITDDFAIGGNIKYMKARVYNTAVKIFDTDFGDAMNKAKRDYTESQNFGVDLGLLYRFGDDLRVGLVGRNLNSPQFKMKKLLPGDADNIKEKPQIRTGIAYKPLSFVTMAADIDVTKNDTTIGSDYKSQNVAGGIELNIFKILQLRGGAYKNLAKNDIGPVYTAGIGLNLWLINVDIGAAMASEKEVIDGNEIPKEARVALALSMLF